MQVRLRNTIVLFIYLLPKRVNAHRQFFIVETVSCIALLCYFFLHNKNASFISYYYYPEFPMSERRKTPNTTKTIHANDPYEFRSILLSARRKSKLISADVV